MKLTFNPSEVYISTLAETEAQSPVGQRIKKIEKDFLETIDDLPTHRARIVNNPDSSRQTLIDFAFAFFVAGIATALDKKSHFNFDRTELEHRRDLN